MQENIIALDILSADKSMAQDLTTAIVETGNRNLKETFKQLRNQIEQEHEEIYQIAEQNGWYMAAGPVMSNQISEFNNFFHQSFFNETPHNQQVEKPQQPQANAQNQYHNSPSQYAYQGNPSYSEDR